MSKKYKCTHPLVKYCNTYEIRKHLDSIEDMIDREDEGGEKSFRRSIPKIIDDFDIEEDETDDIRDLFDWDPISIIEAMRLIYEGEDIATYPKAHEIATQTVRQIALDEFND